MVDQTVVREVYGRCKALGLAVGAGIALGERDPRLHAQAVAIEHDAADARDRAEPPGADPRWAEALLACETAAAALRRLIDDDDHLSTARATQRAMRHAVWRVLECDYEPCGAPSQPVARGGR